MFKLLNDPTAASGNATYQDQAYFDKGDWDILAGGIAGTQVVSGCAVTATGTPDGNANIASGIIRVNGAIVLVAAQVVAIAAGDATNGRFDLISIDSAGAAARVAGTASAVPIYPVVPVDGTTGVPTKVISAAIFMPNGVSTVGPAQIIDKRVISDNLDVGGWTYSPETFTYGSADTPSYVATVPGDLTAKYRPGMRFRCTQTYTPVSSILNYRFDTGALTTDSSANARTLTASGSAPTEVTGKFGTAASFASASTQYYTATDNTEWKPTGSFTVSAWIKTSTTGATQTIAASYAQNTNPAGWWFFVTTTNQVGLRIGANAATQGTGWNDVVGNYVVTDGNWHHVAATWDGWTMKVYVDGVLDAQILWVLAPVYQGTNYPRIGAVSTTSTTPLAGTYFNGVIDDVAVIKGSALLAQEVLDLAVRGTPITAGSSISTFSVSANYIITKSMYDGTNTNLTLYGSTLMNATISAPMFSDHKCPQYFSANPDAWTEVRYSNTDLTKTTPTTGTWYGATNAFASGSLNMAVPVGSWRLSLHALVYAGGTAASTACSIQATLSPFGAPVDGQLDGELLNQGFAIAGSGTTTTAGFPIRLEKTITIGTKTTYNALIRSTATGADASIIIAGVANGSRAQSVIRAICAYL